MTARLRPELADLPAYTPGKTVPGAIKIASNETVHGPLPSVRAAIEKAADNINRYPDKPLVYNVAWKTMVYVLVSMLVHYLERLVDFWREAGGFIAGNQKLLAEIVWPHFWAIQILLVVFILTYCTAREFVRVIGADKVRRIFFGPMQKTQAS